MACILVQYYEYYAASFVTDVGKCLIRNDVGLAFEPEEPLANAGQ